MSQTNVDYSLSPSGAELLDDMLDKEQENLLSSHSGNQRPSYAIAGTIWLDISVTPWLLKIYDGVDDIILGKVDSNADEFRPSNPLSNTGDLFVLGSSGNPTRLPASSVADTVLTSNGANALPSYKKLPIAILEYSATRTYAINDLTMGVVDNTVTMYRSKSSNNTGNALTNTAFWESYNISGKQDVSNLVTSVSSSSTDTQYPSAKLFYDTCGDIETLINAL